MKNKQDSSYVKEGILPFGFSYKVDGNKLAELADKLSVVESMTIDDFIIAIEAHASATIASAGATVIALQESLVKDKLSPSESLLLSKIDKKGRGCISASKAQMILGVGIDDTIKILRDLEIKGYLEYTIDGWRLLWR